MTTIQETIWRADTDADFKAFRNKYPKGAIANRQLGLTGDTGVYMIHMASCFTLSGDRHVEGQADTKYEKYCAVSWVTLHARWPQASLCAKCMGDNALAAKAFVDNLNASVLRTED